MPAGRPTDYTPTLLKKAKDYLSKWTDLGDAVPSVAGFSDYLGISRETAYDWAKDEKKKEFSDILIKIATKQERELINGSLKGNLNAPVSKMLLTKHGYSDKVDQDLTTGGDKLNVVITRYGDSEPTA